jgi:hypothetical protein
LPIGRGENAGRNITYYNVSRRCVKVGDWDGKAEAGPLRRIKSARWRRLRRGYLQSGSAEKPGIDARAARFGRAFAERASPCTARQ